MAKGPINLSLIGSKVARGTPNRFFFFRIIFSSIDILRMRMCSVLVCLPHEQEQRTTFRTIDYPFFNTIIEELRVVKRLITYGLGAD